MNFIHVAGHLGADAEVRYTSTGKKVTTLRLATKTRKGQNDDTIWWRITIWGDQYDKMVPYLKKGSGIIAMGEFHKPEFFNDREGKQQISLEITASFIQFSPFGRPAGAAGHSTAATGAATTAPYGSHAHAGPSASPSEFAGAGMYGGEMKNEGSTFDDEVPF